MENEQEKKKPTKEEMQMWADEAEKKFNLEIEKLAQEGAFKKLEESKAKLEAPVFVMPNGKGYNLHEKTIPLLAKLANADLINKGKTSHLFVSWYSVQKIREENPNINGVKEGSTYMPMVIQTCRINEIGEKENIPSAINLIPMGCVKGDTLDKMKFFLKGTVKNKAGEEITVTNPIPYDNYATRIAKLVDYSKITPEAIRTSGAKEVIAEIWKEAQEKYRAHCEKNQEQFNSKLDVIKNAPNTNKNKLEVILSLYKKNYDKAMETVKQKQESGLEINEVPFPTKASYDTAKDFLLMGESIKDVQGYIYNYDPNSAHNIKGLYYFSNIVFRGLENDYKFNQEYKAKFGKTFRDALKEEKMSYQKKTQGASR